MVFFIVHLKINIFYRWKGYLMKQIFRKIPYGFPIVLLFIEVGFFFLILTLTFSMEWDRELLGVFLRVGAALAFSGGLLFFLRWITRVRFVFVSFPLAIICVYLFSCLYTIQERKVLHRQELFAKEKIRSEELRREVKVIAKG